MNLIKWSQQVNMLKLSPELKDHMTNATTIDRELLVTQLNHFINKHSRFTDPKLRPLMADSLCSFIVDWVNKFDEGQRVYNDPTTGKETFTLVDEDKEVRAEYLDMFSYFELKKWKQKLKKTI